MEVDQLRPKKFNIEPKLKTGRGNHFTEGKLPTFENRILSHLSYFQFRSAS